MKTQQFSAIGQPENAARLAGAIIRSGGLVAFPTETVYGLGANGLDGEAVARIFEAKGRPQDNPLILHVAKKSDVKPLWKHIPDEARQLMDAFWPGPLTIIFNRSSIVPDEVTAGLDTVAVRMPRHKTALALIREAGVPIAAPSANLSGRPSPTCAAHVLADMDGRIDMILDGGPCEVGVESTVISLVGRPTILRPGGVTREMLSAVIGEVDVSKSVLSPLASGETAASPGMKYRHYAPDAEVVMACGRPRTRAGIICREYAMREADGKRCYVLATDETSGFYRGMDYAIIGTEREPETMCSALFARLRECSGNVDCVFLEGTAEGGMGLAYMNRALRASGFTVLYE